MDAGDQKRGKEGGGDAREGEVDNDRARKPIVNPSANQGVRTKKTGGHQKLQEPRHQGGRVVSLLSSEVAERSGNESGRGGLGRAAKDRGTE